MWNCMKRTISFDKKFIKTWSKPGSILNTGPPTTGPHFFAKYAISKFVGNGFNSLQYPMISYVNFLTSIGFNLFLFIGEILCPKTRFNLMCSGDCFEQWWIEKVQWWVECCAVFNLLTFWFQCLASAVLMFSRKKKRYSSNEGLLGHEGARNCEASQNSSEKP